MSSEEAVEFNELDQYLRRNEDYKPFEDDEPLLRAEPIGVPGAYSPLQMYPKHAPSRSPSPSPLKLKEKEKSEINHGDTLAEFGLANVSVSADELRALIEELGLGGDEANDLVKGLSGSSASDAGDTKVAGLKTKQVEEKVTKAEPKDEGKDGGKDEEKDESKDEDLKDEGKEKADDKPANTGEKIEPVVVKVSPPAEVAKAD